MPDARETGLAGMLLGLSIPKEVLDSGIFGNDRLSFHSLTHLDGAKDFRGDQLKISRLQDLLQGDVDCGGYNGSVSVRNCVTLQRLPTERQGGPWDLLQLLDVPQHGICGPRQNGANRLVLHVPSSCFCGNFVDQACKLF